MSSIRRRSDSKIYYYLTMYYVRRFQANKKKTQQKLDLAKAQKIRLKRIKCQPPRLYLKKKWECKWLTEKQKTFERVLLTMKQKTRRIRTSITPTRLDQISGGWFARIQVGSAGRPHYVLMDNFLIEKSVKTIGAGAKYYAPPIFNAIVYRFPVVYA